MDAYLVSALAMIYAEQARILGMQAANDQCKATGGTPTYDEQHFCGAAMHLESLAMEVRNRG